MLVFFAMIVSSATIIGSIWRVTQSQLDSTASAYLVVERDRIIEMFGREGPGGARAVIDAELRISGPLAIMLADRDGALVAGNISVWPVGLPTDDSLRRHDLVREGSQQPETFATVGSILPGNYRLLIGYSLGEGERLTTTLATSLVTAIGIAFVLAVAISFLLTRMITERVQSIADVASAVTAGDLGRRVDVAEAGSGDAFDTLGGALNAMLGRIEALLDELRSVTDGLAHDLRSPLTRLKARIDRVARSGEAGNAEITGIGAEADQLLAMLDNSLEISRAEAGIGRDNFVQMDLAALVNDMVEMYEPLAEDSGIRLTALAPLPVNIVGHREFLGRVLSNLIDNALRYAGSGGIIEVTAEPTLEGARLTVADRGPGIARPNREQALRRFGRLDVARSASGAGLGLSLAAAIARLHGGTLVLLSNNPGLKVTIDLPARIAG